MVTLLQRKTQLTLLLGFLVTKLPARLLRYKEIRLSNKAKQRSKRLKKANENFMFFTFKIFKFNFNNYFD